MVKLCSYGMDRGNPFLEQDIKDIEFKRKLLLERMSVIKSPQINNSQVHLGVGDNVGRDKIKNNFSEKWYQKWWGQIIVGLIILVIGAFFVYKLRLN